MKYYFLFIFISSQILASDKIELKSGDLGSGKIYVPCHLDGQKRDCLFDSGSDSVHFEKSDKLKNYSVLYKMKTKGVSGVPVEYDVISAKKFSVAGLNLENYPISLLPQDNAVGDKFLIGITPFHGQVLHLNTKKSLIVANNEGFGAGEKKFNLFFAPSGIPVLMVGLNDLQNFAVWDTGAGLTSIDSLFVKNNPKLFKFVSDIPGKDSSGNKSTFKLYKLKKLLVADIEFSDLYVLAFDFKEVKEGLGEKVNIILGYNIISNLNWKFDFRTRYWIATK